MNQKQILKVFLSRYGTTLEGVIGGLHDAYIQTVKMMGLDGAVLSLIALRIVAIDIEVIENVHPELMDAIEETLAAYKQELLKSKAAKNAAAPTNPAPKGNLN